MWWTSVKLSENKSKIVFIILTFFIFYSYVAPNRFHKKNYDQGFDNPGYGRYSQQQQQLLHQQDQGLEQIGKNGQLLHSENDVQSNVQLSYIPYL